MKITLISTSTYPSDQGLRSISSILKKNNYKVKLIFLPLEEKYDLKYSKQVLNQISNIAKNSLLIGISSYASTSIRASQLIKHLKQLNIPIVYGGPHPTISPELCINEVNYICRSEGELAILELANKLKNKQDTNNIANLWINKNNKIIKNPIRQLISPLDSLPSPDYDLEDHYILHKNNIRKFKESDLNGMIFFMTERGCPNSCRYCSNDIYKQLCKNKGALIRWHSINYIIKELKRLKNKFPSIKVFDIRDETFLIRPLEEIKEFSKKYKQEIGLRFKCLTDPPTTDEEKLKLLVDAGLTDIILGIQSGSDNINLNLYKRFITKEQVIKATKIINKFNIAPMYDIITSNPYETKEDILATINLLREIPKPYYLSVNNLVFFLGTKLYDQAIEDGTIKTKEDSAYNLNYWDRFKHIKLKKKNAYLNLILNLMRGPCTNKRYGLLPSPILNLLLKEKMINFNLKNNYLTYFIGFFVQILDYLRENIAKPIYRSLPVNFKTWFDKVRYQV